MKRILLLLALLTAVPAQAASPIIYFGTHSKDLTAQGLITQALTVGNTGSQLTVSSSGGLTAPSFIQANGQIFTIGGNNIVSNQNFIGRNLYLKDVFDSHQVGIQSPSAGMTADYNITLPPAQGSATQYMQNDGSGNLSWVSPVTAAPTAYSQAPVAVTAMGTSTFPPLGHTLDTKDFTATNKAAFWNNFSASNLSDNSGFLQCTSGTAACALANTGSAVTFGNTGLTGGTTAASFNGTSAELVCTDSFCKPGSNAAAYYAWINPTSWIPGGAQVIFGQYDAGGNRAMELYIHPSAGVVLNVYASGTTLTCAISGALPSGFSGWHHVAAVIDSTNLKCYLYLDGKGQSATMGAAMFASTTSLKIGSEGATSGAFYSGKMEQIGIANGYLMTADDIRKLAARRIDHNKNIATNNQLWTSNWGRSDSTVATQLDASWLVSKSSTSLWADFSGVATGAFVDFSMQNVGQYGTALVPNSTYDSGVLSAAPSTTIAHGLGARPANIVYQYETTTGHFTPLQGSNFCEADSTNLYCDWTGLSVSGSNRLEIIAGGVPLLSAVPLADATTAGLINGAAAQTIGGAKTFSGQVTASGGIVANVGAQINKQYVVGTAYTNGTPTLTSSQAGFSVTRGVLVPYQTFDGAWRLKFNINTSFTLASTALGSVTFSGVAFNSSASQSCSAYCSNTSTTPRCYTGGSGAISFDFASATSVNGVIVSGDVELASKPTWAD